MKFHKPPYLLREIKIEVTHRCPLACIHCSSDANFQSDLEMDFEDCQNIIADALDMQVEHIAFSGGEPLNWPGLHKTVKQSADGGAQTYLYTSGNVSKINSKLQALKRSGISKVIFSIFGSTDLSHEIITRIKGSFAATIDAIKCSVALGIETEAHFVPIVINYQELRPVVRMLAEMGISKTSVLRFVPQGRGQLISTMALSKLQTLELKKMIEGLRAEGFIVRTGSPFNFLLLNKQPECKAAIDRLIIGPDLKLYPCDAFKQIEASEVSGSNEYSNLEQSNLKSCWKKSPYLQVVRKYLTTDFPTMCISCEYIESCLSGCLAQKVITFGGLGKNPDPMCLLGKGGSEIA